MGASVAQSLIGKEHNLRGIGLVIRPKQLKGQDNNDNRHGGDMGGMAPGMHGMGPGMWGPQGGWGGPNPNPGNAAPPSGYKSYNKSSSPHGSYSWGDQGGEHEYSGPKSGGYGAAPKSYGSGPKY